MTSITEAPVKGLDYKDGGCMLVMFACTGIPPQLAVVSSGMGCESSGTTNVKKMGGSMAIP